MMEGRTEEKSCCLSAIGFLRVSQSEESSVRLTGDGVFVAVALADANQEGTVFVLGGQEQFLRLLPVDVAIVPPAERERERSHDC